ISQVLDRSPKLFPPLVVQMIAVGERAGTIDEMLEEIADFYEKQVDQIMGNLSSIIEPVLIIFLGAAVGGIALAIITPIYALTMKFGQ
uniref:type II secretion system F family protein n=1 Tax=Pseudostreptobacillus hongkongensis TaxID=1162717 RepID=UPI001B80BF16